MEEGLQSQPQWLYKVSGDSVVVTTGLLTLEAIVC